MNEAEIIRILENAIRTGYDEGYRNGCMAGAFASVAVGAVIDLGRRLWAWHKGRPARQRIAAARRDYEKFEAQQNEGKT